MNALRKVGAVAWAAVGSLLLSGCEFNGWYDVQLPGGAAADGHAYHVTVEFRDVLDLVPQSAVKVNNVTVGAVEEVQLDGWHARVRLRVADSVKLPANAVAELRQTSMLGEKYVALSTPPGTAPVGRLGDGDRIPLSRSGRNPDIEEVLSALSALLNGGGVAQLKTITVELNKALDGREDRVRSLLKELNTFIGGLDGRRKDIIHALKAVDRLAGRLGKEKKTIAQAVDTMPPALKVLADQRRDLTRMLTALSKLGTTGTKVVNASHDDTVANLKQLRPILQQLNKAGADLPNSLELLTTYPFPRNAVDAVRGDYVNLDITADLDLSALYRNLAGGSDKSGGGNGESTQPETPDIPDLPDLPTVPTPTALPSAPSLPSSPSMPSAPSGGGGPLCPPVCTSSYTTRGEPPEGIDLALAELMLKGVQP
ncbi:mammalian cell entry protein [Streptomyces avermitilis]|uniref:Mce(Mammalian cell entry)-related protein n=2 Tax=Streptomyces avermitilis TaxID=33903 RepID=Q82B10_STRAW|nr:MULTISPECIES: MCE family protein [Streptomyces]KUN54535.1 mammalian cell entry protein [Streptomyces avermitilis]MYT01454.1 MCE family protein [Streptomyces sp. SID5469]OOV27987.1 mammalian cell entry protein [Streptomyces avermitilis]BAC73607.1 putative mce(mammalian cell entry)-related protein [Streptomyces avermitilis MA-4680 = NBRC 14893]GDY73675.1 ABC transporter substrate-binding protein [Streptomyces avermitilis]